MLPCERCACDLFIVAEEEEVWLFCFQCGEVQPSAALPVPITPFLDPSVVRTGLELHRITNADGLER